MLAENKIKVCCKTSYHCFEKNKYYDVDIITSIFNANDFITIRTSDKLYRFRLDTSTEYIENYIGENEIYFYDYFYSLSEERKNKLNKINSL